MNGKQGSTVLATKARDGAWRSTQESSGKLTKSELIQIVDAAATELLASLAISLDVAMGRRLNIVDDKLVVAEEPGDEAAADRWHEEPGGGGGGGGAYTVYFGWCTNGWTGVDRSSRADAQRDADSYSSKHSDAGTCGTGKETRKKK